MKPDYLFNIGKLVFCRGDLNIAFVCSENVLVMPADAFQCSSECLCVIAHAMAQLRDEMKSLANNVVRALVCRAVLGCLKILKYVVQSVNRSLHISLVLVHR
jgi:hypothetical protein